MSQLTSFESRIAADLGQHRIEVHRLQTQLDEALERARKAETEAKILRMQVERSKAEAPPTVPPEPAGAGNAEQDQQSIKPKPHRLVPPMMKAPV